MIRRTLKLGAVYVLTGALAIPGCSKGDTAGTVTPGTTTGAGIQIEFRSENNPPVPGDNPIEVTVRRDGVPVTDATVTVVFSMPAMPSMNMPEMRSTATLTPQGDGRYRGTGELSMDGTWNVKVTVARGADQLGTHTLSIVAN